MSFEGIPFEYSGLTERNRDRARKRQSHQVTRSDTPPMPSQYSRYEVRRNSYMRPPARKAPFRKVYSKPNYSKTGIRSTIRSVVKSMAETKLISYTAINESITTANNIVVPYYIPLAPPISQGSGQNNRVGNSIMVTSGHVEGYVNLLPYNATTNTLTTTTFNGALTGNATTATDATNISITDTTASASLHYLLFSSATSGNTPAKIDSTGLTYTPSTNTLTATTFTGALSGNATTATSSTTATNANNVNLAAGSGTTNYITFSASATGNQPINTDTGLTFD